MTKYVRFSENYKVNKLIPITDSPHSYVKDKDKPYFISMMTYDQSQYDEYVKTKSLAGMSGSLTNKVWFDFDSKDNIKLAFNDTVVVVNKLLDLGLKEEQIQVSFSGSKGTSIIVETTNQYNIEQVKAFCFGLAKDLSTFDTSLYDNQRIFRLNYTKNEKTGLYKIPLSLEELKEANIDSIKETAKIDPTPEEITEVNSYYEIANFQIPEEYLNIQNIKPKLKEVKIVDSVDIDWSRKPKFLTNCRWALQNGLFKAGQRSHPLLALASTYKNLGFDLDHVYRLLKGVAELQSKRNNCERFPDTELYNNIVVQVFSDKWGNGQYSCKNEGNFLFDYCKSLGTHKCDHKEDRDLVVSPDGVHTLFTKYAHDFDKNVLFTGIKQLDEKMKLMVGTSNGLLAPPGVGKTSMSLSILNHNSLMNNKSIFFSYDMFHSALYMRMLQKHTGFQQEKIYDLFRNNDKQTIDIFNKINDNYKNVKFCFKAGQTPDEIEDTIKYVQDNTGEKVKLIIVDYNELVVNNMSDSTASSALTAQRLRQIANEHEVCVLTLLQPSKNYSSPADEITNFNAAKGSSSIAQALTVMLGCSRPGFNPRKPENDNFFNITCLKNRNGPLFSLDFSWHGLSGNIGELSSEQEQELEELRAAKLNAENANNSNSNWD